MRGPSALILVVLSAAPASAQGRPAEAGVRLLQDAAIRAALAKVKQDEPRTVEDQIRLCEIPAPPFKEQRRGEAYRQMLVGLGLKNVRIDEVGNVIGERPGAAARPNAVISAHLDTVFPEGTNVKVSREGPVLKGPGIGDNCRGLAVVLAVIRALDAARVQTPGTLTFVATVGEEGLGDLRGVRHLVDQTLKGRIDRFVSIDGTGLGITHIAVGSRRYRVTFKGPGGHSYGAFGMPNPIHALGRAIEAISEFEVPRIPKTTFSVGRIAGGTSVNAIPSDAWLEVDMRSVDAAALQSLEAKFHKVVDAAVREEAERWGVQGQLSVSTELVSDRPAGEMPADSAIVVAAVSVTRALGLAANLGEGSTDANYPISLKIPAITMGGGGRGTGSHSPGEAFDATDAWQGTQRATLLAIALAQGR